MFFVPRRVGLRDWRVFRVGVPSVRDLSVAALAVAFIAAGAIASSAFGQSAGCSRCTDAFFKIGPFSIPNPFASPMPAQPAFQTPGPVEHVRRSVVERRDFSDWPTPSSPHRHVASLGHELRGGSSQPGKGGGSGDWSGGPVYVCVRTCDGGFFPLPYSGATGATLEEICQALCPNAEVALYTMPFGGTIDQGVSTTGSPYTAQPYALKFQQSYEETCSCRRPGQSWADALAAAEARFGRRSHEIVVTAEASAEMSRPKRDPNAKRAAASAPSPKSDQESGIQDAADPELDINGVDTKLKAATEAVSRETSGIKDDETKTGSLFGLKQGRTVEEDDPEGGRRRVRILAPAD